MMSSAKLVTQGNNQLANAFLARQINHVGEIGIMEEEPSYLYKTELEFDRK
jgi:hypothetical protein